MAWCLHDLSRAEAIGSETYGVTYLHASGMLFYSLFLSAPPPPLFSGFPGFAMQGCSDYLVTWFCPFLSPFPLLSRLERGCCVLSELV
jgi:hypothetical protein